MLMLASGTGLRRTGNCPRGTFHGHEHLFILWHCRARLPALNLQREPLQQLVYLHPELTLHSTPED